MVEMPGQCSAWGTFFPWNLPALSQKAPSQSTGWELNNHGPSNLLHKAKFKGGREEAQGDTLKEQVRQGEKNVLISKDTFHSSECLL